jgi:hypothetical protein
MANVFIKVTKGTDSSKIEVVGSIDESFSQFTGEIPKDGNLEFALNGLKSINSMGIREWIKLMQSLPKAQISFTRCPKIFIDQVNMVSGFIPANSKVASFYVPYYNEDLDAETMVLYKLGEHYTANSVQVQENYKDESGNAFELDVVKAKYFKFIQTV